MAQQDGSHSSHRVNDNSALLRFLDWNGSFLVRCFGGQSAVLISMSSICCHCLGLVEGQKSKLLPTVTDSVTCELW